MDMQEICSLCAAGSIRWTFHITRRLLERGISLDDVVEALQDGEIIEQYADDVAREIERIAKRLRESKTEVAVTAYSGMVA